MFRRKKKSGEEKVEPDIQSMLYEALKEGDPYIVRVLVDRGADIHYTRPHGYDALIDAVHSTAVSDGPRLLKLLSLLVRLGVNLSGVTTYNESGLRVLSRIGRFDGVRLLLDAGADRSHLEWTPLMEAVALGSLGDVRAALDAGESLEARDWWSRTPFLIAVLSGDIAKAMLLREYGANTNACGHCNHPPLFYAIPGNHPEMLRWLISQGADVHQTDEFGTTALIEASEMGDAECVKILLEAGADVSVDAAGTALNQAASRDVAILLLDAGADPADADHRTLLGLEENEETALYRVTPDEFRRAARRRFGRTNPERFDEPFLNAMIRCGATAYSARVWFGEDAFPRHGAGWCADRFGQSLTFLPDGRAVQIGGEHEDYYDPDFCIYNDVFVHDGRGGITVYGYPEEVFPPTDFHTATLIGDSIYVIGSLGYQDARRPGFTPVYRLDTNTLRFEGIPTTGAVPGWIFKHRAVASGPHEIRVWGGEVIPAASRDGSPTSNADAFRLDLETLRWRRE